MPRACPLRLMADVECCTPVLKGENLGDWDGELAVCGVLGELADGFDTAGILMRCSVVEIMTFFEIRDQ
ncbi:MAG: hypothetical protein P4N59_24000 [Negativicutes bacterium]|nr:hypothetical protein [Negativicutes bacterium]